MMVGFLEELGKYFVGGLVGGMLTGAGTYIGFNNKVSNLSTRVEIMEKSCDGCKTNTVDALQTIVKDLNNHRADDEKHNNSASHQMLFDILSRVTRIENRLLQKDV